MSILHASPWRVEIKATARDREASAGPSKVFGFISTAYFELISRNQNSVVLEDLQSQEGMQRGWEVQTDPSVGGEEDASPGWALRADGCGGGGGGERCFP